MIGTLIDNWKRIVFEVPNPRLQQLGYNRNSRKEILEEFEIGSNSRKEGSRDRRQQCGFQKQIMQTPLQA
jgi:hypothetical protein